MSKEWLKEFCVLVKAPVRIPSRRMMCVIKTQKAPTREKAQELVANYCAHHRKKRNLASDENFLVIKNPVRVNITYTYNHLSNQRERFALLAELDETKAAVFEVLRHADINGGDDTFVAKALLVGDAFIRHHIEPRLRFYQKENAIIDYSIQVEPYEGDDICNHYMIFKSFNDKFFA